MKRLTVNQVKVKQFTYLRAQIGHRRRILDKTMNSYVAGNQQDISILNSIFILWSWERASQILTRVFLFRQKFVFLSTNKFIPNSWLNNFLEWHFQLKNNRYPHFLGYVGTNWYGGLLSNWSKLWAFVLLVFKDLLKKKHVSKTRHLLMKKLAGRISKGNQPAFPDFLFALTADKGLLHESDLIRLVSVGLVDSDKNIKSASISLIGNDDSFLLIEFMVRLIEQSFLVSSREEHELFYRILFKKLKNLLY